MEMSTVLDAWILYDELVLSYLSKHERVAEVGRWRKHIFPEFASVELETIKTLHILYFKRHLDDKNLSPQSVYHCLSLLRRILRKALVLELYDGKLPIFDMPRFDNRRQRYLSHDEAESLLSSIKIVSALWHDIALLALQTGLRASEIFHLKRAHVSFDSKLIAVFDSKNNVIRHVPMNEIAENLLKLHFPPKPEGYFFVNAKGHPFGKVSKIFRTVVNKAGLYHGVSDRRSQVVFHTLRLTFASWLVHLPGGTPIQLVGEILGHKTLRMTQRYAHLSSEQRFKAVQKLVNVFSYGKPSDEGK
jgi:integrase